MFFLHIDQDNAFIMRFKAAQVKQQASGYNCFYSVIEQLAPVTPTNPQFTAAAIQKIQTAAENRIVQFQLCTTMCMGIHSSAKSKTDNEICSITHRNFAGILVYEILENYKRNQEILQKKTSSVTLNEAVVTEFVKKFIAYFKRNNPGDGEIRSFHEWLEYAIEYGRHTAVFELKAALAQPLQTYLSATERDAISVKTDSEAHQATYEQSLLQRKLATNYGFSTAAWNPTNTIDEFLSLFRNNKRPFIVSGNLGKFYYKANPTEYKIGNSTVYGWGSDDLKVTNSLSHCVAVIGASKKGYCDTKQDLIYFTDLADGDPKIYVMRYEGFCKRVSNINGEIISPDHKSFTKSTPYLFFHPQMKLSTAPKPSFWSEKCDLTTVAKVAAATTVALVVGYALS